MSRKLWRGSNPSWKFGDYCYLKKKNFRKEETFEVIDRYLYHVIYHTIMCKEECMLTSLGDDMIFSFLLQKQHKVGTRMKLNLFKKKVSISTYRPTKVLKAKTVKRKMNIPFELWLGKASFL